MSLHFLQKKSLWIALGILVVLSALLILTPIGKLLQSSLLSPVFSNTELEKKGILKNLGDISTIINVKDGTVLTDKNGDHIYYGTISTTVKGRFFAFNLDKKQLLDEKDIKGQGVWNVKSFKGDIYFGTYYPAILYKYVPETKELKALTMLQDALQKPNLEYIWDIAFDDTGVYMGTYDGEPVKYDFATGATSGLGSLSEAKYSRSLVTANGKVYIGFGGARKDNTDARAELVEYDPATHMSTNILPQDLQLNSIPNAMTVVDGKILVFYDQWIIFQYNPQTKQFKKLFYGGDISGKPVFDTTHIIFTGLGGQLYMYDTVHENLVRVSQYGFWARQSGAYFMNNDTIKLVTYDGDVITETSDGTVVDKYYLADYGLHGAETLPFSMAAGDHKVIIGSTKLRILDTDTGHEKYQSPAGEPKVMTFSNGALFTANYAAGNLWKFPDNDLFSNKDSFQDAKYIKYTFGAEQIRPKGIAASKDGKILVGSEPGYGLYGGALEYHDDVTGEQYTVRNIVPKHTIYSVAFDENDSSIAYLGTSAIGGTGTGVGDLLETAHIVKYDLRQKKVLFDVIPTQPLNNQYDRTIKVIVPYNGKLYAISSFGSLLVLDEKTGTVLNRIDGEAYIELLLSREGNLFSTKSDCFGLLDSVNLTFSCIKNKLNPSDNLLVQDSSNGMVYFNDYTTLWGFDEVAYTALQQSIQGITFYQNPYDRGKVVETYEPMITDMEISVDKLKNAPELKDYKRSILGAMTVHDASGAEYYIKYPSMLASYGKMIEAIGLAGVRFYNSIEDLLDPKGAQAWIDASYRAQGYPNGTVKASDGGFQTAADYANMVKSRYIQLDGESRIIFTILSTYAFDPDESYVDKDGTTKKGVSHYIPEDKEKYIPIHAKNAARIAQSLKDRFGEAAFKDFYFEIGNEEYWSTPPAIHAEVVYETAKEMRKVVPDIKVAFNNNPYDNGDIINGLTLIGPKEKEALRKYYGPNVSDADLTKFDNEEVFKKLAELNKKEDLRGNIVGVEVHHYNTADKVSSMLSEVRALAKKYDFPNLKFWFSEYHFFGKWYPLSNFSENLFSNYIRESLGLAVIRDLDSADYIGIPGSGHAGIVINGVSSDPDQRVYTHVSSDPFLNATTTPTSFWKINPSGVALRILNDVVLGTEKDFIFKQYRRGKNLFTAFGFTPQGNLRGVLENREKTSQEYTIKNSTAPYLKVLTAEFNSKLPAPVERKRFFDLTAPEYKQSLETLRAEIQNTKTLLQKIQTESFEKMNTLLAPQSHEIQNKIATLKTRTPATADMNLAYNPEFNDLLTDNISATNWNISVVPKAESSTTLIDGNRALIIENKSTDENSGYVYQFQGMPVKKGDIYVATAKVRKMTDDSAAFIYVVHNPWQGEIAEQAEGFREASNLSSTVWKSIATKPFTLQKDNGVGNIIGMIIRTNGKILIDNVRLINCTAYPEVLECAQQQINELEDFNVPKTLTSISTDPNVLYDPNQFAARYYEMWKKVLADAERLGIPAVPDELFNIPVRLHAQRYINEDIKAYENRAVDADQTLLIRTILRDFFEYMDPLTYSTEKVMTPQPRNNLQTVYPDAVHMAEVQAQVKKFRDIIKNISSKPGWIEEYIADTRLELFPIIKESYIYPDSQGNFKIILKPGMEVFVGEGEYTTHAEDILLESLPVIQKGIEENRLDYNSLPVRHLKKGEEQIRENISVSSLLSWNWTEVLFKESTLSKVTLRTITPLIKSTFETYENERKLMLSASSSEISSYTAKNAKNEQIRLIMNNSENAYKYTLSGQNNALSGLQISPATSTGSYLAALEKYKAASDLKDAMSGTGSGFLWGVNGHTITQEGYNKSGVTLTEQLDKIREAGLTSYRLDINGKTIPEDILTESAKRNITVLPVIFAPVNLNTETDLQKIEKTGYDYAYEIANKYKAQIPVWELQNEQDNYTMIKKGETTMKGVVWKSDGAPDGNDIGHYEVNRTKKVNALLKGMNNGIHAADPSLKTTVDAGWLHYGYIQNLADAGVNFDILSWHWYSNMGDITKVKGTINLVQILGRFGKPLWITEGNRWGGDIQNTGVEQAIYARNIIAQMRALNPLIKAYYFYELLDEPYFGETNYESHFGLMKIIRGTGGKWVINEMKPVYYAIKELLTAETILLSEQIKDFPNIQRITVLPNNDKSVEVSVPAGSILVLSENPLLLQETTLFGEKTTLMKDVLGGFYPKLSQADIKTLQTPDKAAPAENANMNTVGNGNLNALPMNQNAVTQLNTNNLAGSVNQNVFVQTPINTYMGAGNTSTSLGTLNQNQNLKSSPVVFFTDIENNFAKTYINALASRGIIQGRTSGKFEPNGTLNRAEAVKLAIKTFSPDQNESDFMQEFKGLHGSYTYVYFKDVLLNTWYAGYVGIAKEKQIVHGTQEGVFEPGRNISRAEFLKIVLEAQGKNIHTESTNFMQKTSGYFKDVRTQDWYRIYVYAAANMGLIDTNDMFYPNRSITRAEAVKILYMASENR